ncbi:MAG TPA: zinc ribbon domain-containing protein [Vicinamibacterales bacterium]|nr:zinc ribbon domain-containing protein [Vicinamibacterales bacterium]
MPLFDFECRKCRHEFEALVRPGDEPSCPACGSRDLERLLSAFAVDTAEKRQAAAKQSRRRQIAKRKDALIADEEYRQKHDKE